MPIQSARSTGQRNGVRPQSIVKSRTYLSRGSGPGTAHYVAKPDIPEKDETFEIWIVGEVK